VLLALIGLAFAVPILWVVSVGAVRDARRARELDPRAGCQAWVEVPRLRGRRYRCGSPVHVAGGDRCLRHRAPPGDVEVDAPQDPSLTYLDQPAAAGRALALARIGVPLAVLAVLATVVLLAWLFAG
jgi:hypothetical protein